ncbi:hypothetical protein ACG83_01995 [Frankia sp. R43]|nr:hypothetical protein ACG83_01995 [Frankia sp. R43]
MRRRAEQFGAVRSSLRRITRNAAGRDCQTKCLVEHPYARQRRAGQLGEEPFTAEFRRAMVERDRQTVQQDDQVRGASAVHMPDSPRGWTEVLLGALGGIRDLDGGRRSGTVTRRPRQIGREGVGHR